MATAPLWKLVAAGTITAAAVVVFVYTLVGALWYAPQEEASSPALAAHAPAIRAPLSSWPSHLRVPSLDINANVQHVGVGKTGNMAVPTNFTDAAWYKYGPLPGEAGSAVIDGHVDNALALPGVFKRLSEIQKGADIYVDAATTSVHFKVTDVESYPAPQVPVGQIFSNTGVPRLVLITCDGVWIQGQNQYDRRLVVYAQLAQ